MVFYLPIAIIIVISSYQSTISLDHVHHHDRKMNLSQQVQYMLLTLTAYVYPRYSMSRTVILVSCPLMLLGWGGGATRNAILGWTVVVRIRMIRVNLQL
jgi:hypothetical protein